jgi:hypothetical protein
MPRTVTMVGRSTREAELGLDRAAQRRPLERGDQRAEGRAVAQRVDRVAARRADQGKVVVHARDLLGGDEAGHVDEGEGLGDQRGVAERVEPERRAEVGGEIHGARILHRRPGPGSAGQPAGRP